MRLEELHEQNLDGLPYFVREIGTGQAVLVHFERISVADLPVLAESPWKEATFRAFWVGAVGTPGHVLKLVITGASDPAIQGLLLPGTMPTPGRWLQESLLEAAPNQQFGRGARKYTGVGRALIARLVAESYVRGGEGRLLVRARPAVRGFYEHLGFRRLQGTPDFYRLESAEAAWLFEAALHPDKTR